jgi:hypothetical protein
LKQKVQGVSKYVLYGYSHDSPVVNGTVDRYLPTHSLVTYCMRVFIRAGWMTGGWMGWWPGWAMPRPRRSQTGALGRGCRAAGRWLLR